MISMDRISICFRIRRQSSTRRLIRSRLFTFFFYSGSSHYDFNGQDLLHLSPNPTVSCPRLLCVILRPRMQSLSFTQVSLFTISMGQIFVRLSALVQVCRFLLLKFLSFLTGSTGMIFNCFPIRRFQFRHASSFSSGSSSFRSPGRQPWYPLCAVNCK